MSQLLASSHMMVIPARCADAPLSAKVAAPPWAGLSCVALNITGCGLNIPELHVLR